MKIIKRTSPGPKIGPTGSTIGAKKEIGTRGSIRADGKSTQGGQFPFMPSPSAKKGEASDTKTGQQFSERSENFYDFMPRKAGEKK
jgi:hypothetical protein